MCVSVPRGGLDKLLLSEVLIVDVLGVILQVLHVGSGVCVWGGGGGGGVERSSSKHNPGHVATYIIT